MINRDSGKLMGKKRWRKNFWQWLPLALIVIPLTLLFCWDLGRNPLRIGEETTLVESARHWLAALQNYGLTGFNSFQDLGRSPLPLLLISFGKVTFGQGLWGDRLAGVLLNCLALPWLYWIGKSLYGRSLPALLAVVVYGTSAGVIYWGRVASVNSFLLPLTIFFLASLLFCRRDLRGGLPLGLSLAGLGLTDLSTALLMAVTAGVFLHWDTPRLKSSPLFWLGLGLGLLPAIAWWGFYSGLGQTAEAITLLDNSSLPLKIRGWLWVIVSAPGLIFALHTFPQAQQALHWSWSRFLVCQTGVYGLLIILSPWPSNHLVMPLFAPLALAAGFSLAEVYQASSAYFYPSWWRGFFLILGGIFLLSVITIYNSYSLGNLGNWTAQDAALTMLMLTLLGSTFSMTALLLDRHRSEFINVLFWGLFVCLFLAIYTPLGNLEFVPLPHLVASTTNQFPAGL